MHSRMAASPTLSSPPSTVEPSVWMSPSVMRGSTPQQGGTQSMWQVRTTLPGRVPGSVAMRLPVSLPVMAAASSVRTEQPASSSARRR